MRILAVLLTIVLSVLPLTAPIAAENPEQFATVPEMVEDFNDYLAEMGTFEILKQNPLKIRLSPRIFEGDQPEVIEDGVRRALI